MNTTWTIAGAAVALAIIGGVTITNRPKVDAQQYTATPPMGGKNGTNGTDGSTYLTGTSSSIGGGLLTAASCTSGTATVTGATTAMTAAASPVTYPGDGAQYQAYVSSANTVTVKVCALLLITPVSTQYRVRVFP